jgi:hypothetical protein
MVKHKLKQGPNTGSHACLDYTLITDFPFGRAERAIIRSGSAGFDFQKDVLGCCFGLTLIARQGHQPAQPKRRQAP